MLPVAPMLYTGLANVQVGKTSAWWNGLYHQRQGTCIHVHPFGRASRSVINRLIRAGSLLSPTCPSGDNRAMPSVLQAATPMKPRANPGNRTRQPKGCASRIAKPARLGCASQNHLMMIILNKTVAATVAQHDLEPLAVHAQSETTACKRHVLCANFSKTRALFLLLSHRPQRKGRAGAPHGGVFVVYATLAWLSGCVLACRVVSRVARSLLGAIVSVPVVAVVPVVPAVAVRRVAPGRGRAVSVAWLRRRGFASPSCGCDTPMDASVYNGFGVVCVGLICLTFARRV